MSDNESDCDYSEKINEMYEQERDALKSYLDIMESAEQYTPIEEVEENQQTQMYAHYPGVDSLIDDLEFETNKYENGNINLCVYYINQTGKAPFLQYILRKYDKTHETKKDLTTFPGFYYEKGLPIVGYNNYILNIIRASYRIKTGNYEYKGFINNGNQFYVFYDFSDCIIRCHDLNRANDLWLVTMDEIINHKRVCNFPIDAKVSNFFSDLNNLHFTYLKDEDDNIYECPIVAYTGMDATKVDFVSCFGEHQSVQGELPDPYYYFTDYQKAFKVGGFTKNVNNKTVLKNAHSLRECQGGLLRFALFTGYVKMLSEKKKDKDNEYEHLYNSVYLSDDDGHPKWALKKYEQQCQLTCHFINKSELEEEEWNSEGNYYII